MVFFFYRSGKRPALKRTEKAVNVHRRTLKDLQTAWRTVARDKSGSLEAKCKETMASSRRGVEIKRCSYWLSGKTTRSIFSSVPRGATGTWRTWGTGRTSRSSLTLITLIKNKKRKKCKNKLPTTNL